MLKEVSIKFAAEKKKMCKEAISGSKEYKDKEDRIIVAFKAWDKDQNGFITKDELSDVLLHLGCKTNSSDVQTMLKEADLDADGKINYEEMVHWICRAPHLEDYFLKSVEIEKEAFLAVVDECGKVSKELGALEKQYQGQDIENDPEATRKVLDVFKRMDGMMTKISSSSQARIEKELTPIIKRSFAYHDKDGSGKLTEDESIIFFSNFMALWEPFDQVMCEMNCICEGYQHNSEDEEDEKKKKVLEKVKVVTPVALHKALRSKYSILKQEQSKNMEKHLKKAYGCLCVDGQIDENAVVQALLHGTEKNQEFLECMGYGETQGMASRQLAELTSQELGGTMEDIEMGLKMMAAADQQMKMLTGQDMEASQAELDEIAKDLDPVAHQLAGAIAANDGDCKVQ